MRHSSSPSTQAPKLKATHCHAPLKPHLHHLSHCTVSTSSGQFTMFFLFTCGSHSKSPLPPRGQKPEPGTKLTCVFLSPLTAFQSRLKGAEHLTVQCQNCGNLSGHVYRRWQWFTFCFVPVIPLSVTPWRVSSSPLSSLLPQSYIRQPNDSPPAPSQQVKRTSERIHETNE